VERRVSPPPSAWSRSCCSPPASPRSRSAPPCHSSRGPDARAPAGRPARLHDRHRGDRCILTSRSMQSSGRDPVVARVASW